MEPSPSMSAASTSVLLVDDNPDDVLLIRRAFHKANLLHPIHVAADGDEAVAYLSGQGGFADRSQHPLPVLVLLDLKLPKRSGHEVLEWLRAQEGLRRIPVAILTSSQEPVDVKRAYDLGANAYLLKPLEFEALIELVKATTLFWFILNEAPDIRGDTHA